MSGLIDRLLTQRPEPSQQQDGLVQPLADRSEQPKISDSAVLLAIAADELGVRLRVQHPERHAHKRRVTKLWLTPAEGFLGTQTEELWRFSLRSQVDGRAAGIKASQYTGDWRLYDYEIAVVSRPISKHRSSTKLDDMMSTQALVQYRPGLVESTYDVPHIALAMEFVDLNNAPTIEYEGGHAVKGGRVDAEFMVMFQELLGKGDDKAADKPAGGREEDLLARIAALEARLGAPPEPASEQVSEQVSEPTPTPAPTTPKPDPTPNPEVKRAVPPVAIARQALDPDDVQAAIEEARSRKQRQ